MNVIKLERSGTTCNSINLYWNSYHGEDVQPIYRLQMKHRIEGWITKYWGFKTKTEVTGLGPEECYHFRVGVAFSSDKMEEAWSNTVVSCCKDDWNAVIKLHRAVQQGNLNATRKFLSSRAIAIDWYDNYGYSALMKACQMGDAAMVGLLLAFGANVELTSKAVGRTALMFAASYGYSEIVQLLIEKGALWSTKDRTGCMALHFAVDTSQLDIIDLALDNGADIEATDKSGWTPLMRGIILACKKEVLEKLIERGANVNATDKHGQTCPMQAALIGDAEVLAILTRAGADLKVVNNYKHNVLQMASIHSDKSNFQALTQQIQQYEDEDNGTANLNNKS